MKIEFTDEEMFLLNQGIIELIQNSCEAEKLIPDERINSAISSYRKKLIDLNMKIMLLR